MAEHSRLLRHRAGVFINARVVLECDPALRHNTRRGEMHKMEAEICNLEVEKC